ncbi:MAG: hypothetical protein M3335_03455 [Actinomycetota bacterium]|nr:hypothetical protein [Actinomycetota bacterium]
MVGAVGVYLVWGNAAPATAEACSDCWDEIEREEEEREREDQETPGLWYEKLDIGIWGVGSVGTAGTIYCQSTNPTGKTCEESTEGGVALSLSATPGPGMTFIGWEGDCSGTGTCEVMMNQPRYLRALFDDGIPPLPPTIVTPAKGEVVQQPAGSGVVVTFNGSGDPSIRSYLCRLNTSDYRRCTSPWTTRHLKPGPNTVRIKAIDLAGNTTPPVTRRFTVVD